MRRSALAALALSPLLAIACTSEPPTPGAASTTSAEPSAETTAEEPAERAPGAPLSFDAPEGWVAETPSNSMRVAQFRLPAPAGLEGDASVVVFQLGGDVQSNIDRWRGQFAQPDGGETPVVHVTREVNGMRVDDVTLSGTYSGGMGGGGAMEGATMRVAIVHSDHGLYFVRLLGPSDTVDAWGDELNEYVESAS